MKILALAVTGRGLVEPEEPVLRADDEALLRGRAAFETLRVYRGVPFRIEQHLDRLAGSSAAIGLPAVDRAALGALATAALEAAGAPDAVLRLFWTPGPEEGPPTGLALVEPAAGAARGVACARDAGRLPARRAGPRRRGSCPA